MHDKLDIYDVLGVLVPGVLVVCAAPLAFPSVSDTIATAELPDGFGFVGLTAASVFTGYLVQALASLVEPVLHQTWGGRPSERALTAGLGDRYFTAADGARIREKLTPLAGANATDQSLFYIAMHIAEASPSTRVPRFHALYAYHRALLVLTLIAIVLFVLSFWGGFASRLSASASLGSSSLLLALLALFWHRTRQRAYYYVREVLLCAERRLAAPND